MRPLWSAVIAAVLGLVVLVAPVLAQEQGKPTQADMLAQAEAILAGLRSGPGEGAEPPPEPDIESNLLALERFFEKATPEQKAAFRARYAELFSEGYAAALDGQFAYYARGYRHRAAVFDWQLRSSMYIFGAVLVLLAAGLWFSWKQFQLGMEQSRATGKALEMGRRSRRRRRGSSFRPASWAW